MSKDELLSIGALGWLSTVICLIAVFIGWIFTLYKKYIFTPGWVHIMYVGLEWFVIIILGIFAVLCLVGMVYFVFALVVTLLEVLGLKQPKEDKKKTIVSD